MPAPSSSKPGTARRGRRPAVNVPCNDCIARASKKKEDGAALELCARCTAVLHRPRRKLEQTSVQRVRRQSTATNDASLPIPSDIPSVPWTSNQQEQQGMQSFVTHSAPQFAGYFDSPFWQRMVLQTGQHEPAVRHAIAAIGALHETLVTGSIDARTQSEDGRTRYALEQCNASIQHLVKPSRPKSKPDLQLMLTTCVLYTYFEALQGHHDEAMIYARQGYSLLGQYAMDPKNRRWDVGAFAVELDQLCLLMRRLQQTLSKSSSSGSRSSKTSNPRKVLPLLESIKDSSNSNNSTPSSLTFTSLSQARSSLEVPLNHLMILFLDMELDEEIYHRAILDPERRETYTPWLVEWERAFTLFLSNSQHSLSGEDRRTAMILKAHHLVAEIMAGIDLSLSKLGWDAFHQKFAAIVSLAAAVLKDDSMTEQAALKSRFKHKDGSEIASSAEYSISLDVVDPLYEVCTRCQDAALRNRALDMLANHPRQEFLWSSWSVWKAGQLLMLREEQEEEQQQETEAWTLDELDQQTNYHTPRPSTSHSISKSTTTIVERTSTPEMSYTTPTPSIQRTLPRRALNPGLYAEEEEAAIVAATTDELVQSLTSYDEIKLDSRLSFSQASLTPESTSALATTSVPEAYDTPDWIDYDYDAFQQGMSVPAILETPPED